jgi:hypothetical protein
MLVLNVHAFTKKQVLQNVWHSKCVYRDVRQLIRLIKTEVELRSHRRHHDHQNSSGTRLSWYGTIKHHCIISIILEVFWENLLAQKIYPKLHPSKGILTRPCIMVTWIWYFLATDGYPVGMGQTAEALCYKPEDRGFDVRWCHSISQFT